ncbi:hypothetical protein [Moorella sp. Hama-1]|uniref:hypothetical protein n=1 Tax=Moorella sp. Hama-1 TaxID=2138101 RepID=UPI000D65927B|nr:hypothetical protein [Moorella sp. Hama-1]BCV20708.1 hypothetical protein hamaS1_07770 [Moorella sp. Hama-1]
MERIEIRAPGWLVKLPPREREAIIVDAMNLTAKRKTIQLKHQIKEAEEQIKRLETKYNMTYEEFQKKIAPHMEDFETHRDDTEWEMWLDVVREAKTLLSALEGQQ